MITKYLKEIKKYLNALRTRLANQQYMLGVPLGLCPSIELINGEVVICNQLELHMCKKL